MTIFLVANTAKKMVSLLRLVTLTQNFLGDDINGYSKSIKND